MRGAVIGTGLLLVLGACTPTPAPVAKPTTATATATSSSTAAPSCREAIATMPGPSETYREVVPGVAVPVRRTILQAEKTNDGPTARWLFSKWGLEVRTGVSADLAIGPGMNGRALIGWGTPGKPAPQVHAEACPATPAGSWNAFSGGTWVAEPACVPLVIRSGGREATIRMPIGAACT